MLALLPLDVRNLGELEIGGVGREQAGSRGGGRGQADLRVDVEHAGGAAWGPDGRGGVGLVVLEVVACHRAGEGVFGRGLCMLAVCIFSEGEMEVKRRVG